MKPEHARRAAAILAEGWREGLPLEPLPEECRPRTPAEGYRIQDLLTAALDAAIGGWKVGATGAAARKLLGARGPFAGRVLAGRIFETGAALPGSAYGVRGLEAEFAFRLAKPLPPRARPWGLAAVKSAVGAVHPAIEVVGPRFAAGLACGLPSLIADQGGNAALVLGPKLRGGTTLDLRKVAVAMEVDGQVVGSGTGADVLGDPWASLLWLANHARRRGGLAAGQVVTTGTCTGLFKAPAGCRVRALFAGRPAVEFALAG
jgi:2-oxo-3-hexenedioate decarboxylase